ncbi:MAG: flagellar basal-body rod protein FlgC [Clostridia bacterium]|jgi:flagellar basal-body rod protein FlgC|nr:flagellar basal-body rod protein FlgC [Clostridia bacterium]
MSFLNSLNISGSALTAQKFRMNVISQNISNANTTRTENGQPYRRKLVIFNENKNNVDFSSTLNNSLKENIGAGVEVSAVVEDQSNFKLEFNPDHPHADADGYVRMPNVDTVEEMVDMISATRSYEANITAFNAMKFMASKALEIGK